MNPTLTCCSLAKDQILTLALSTSIDYSLFTNQTIALTSILFRTVEYLALKTSISVRQCFKTPLWNNKWCSGRHLYNDSVLVILPHKTSSICMPCYWNIEACLPPPRDILLSQPDEFSLTNSIVVGGGAGRGGGILA